MKKCLILAYLFLININSFGFQTQKIKVDSIAIYTNKGNVIKALSYARKQSLCFLNTKKYNDYCLIMIKKSNLYQNLNDSENALKTLYEAKNTAEKHQMQANLFDIHREIGIIDSKIFEYKKAFLNFKKAERIALKLNDENKLTDIYRAYYIIFRNIKPDSCKYYIDKTIYHSRNDKSYRTRYKNNDCLAAYYFDINDTKKFKRHIFRA